MKVRVVLIAMFAGAVFATPAAAQPTSKQLLAQLDIQYVKRLDHCGPPPKGRHFLGCALVNIYPAESSLLIARWLTRPARKVVRAHEIGHALWLWTFDPAERTKISAALGRDQWAEERAADAWAACHTRAAAQRKASFEGAQTPQRRACGLLKRAASSVICRVENPDGSSFVPPWCDEP